MALTVLSRDFGLPRSVSLSICASREVVGISTCLLVSSWFGFGFQLF